MKILVIDDKDQQLDLAKAAAEAMGWQVVATNPTTHETGKNYAVSHWIKLMEDVDGVVTDLMWPHADRDEQPSGLLAVIHAQFLGKPVVICTNSKDYPGGHHGKAIGFINDGYRTSIQSDCPFGWEEDKNWNRAMALLAERVKK